MFYTIYKITNLINNKIYIGCHKTNNLDDGYMGSGKILKRAQEKYGIENFEKEILEIFDNAESMFEMESILVNSAFVDRDDTYNLKEGGTGGFDHLNKDCNLMIERNKRAGTFTNQTNSLIQLKWLHENDPIWLEKKKQKFLASIKKYYETHAGSFTGKKHTVESKKKISLANSINQMGECNSQYGTMWIFNIDLKESKKINKNKFAEWEAQGWLKGRKMRF